MVRDDAVKVQIILGSTRQGRFGDKVGRWFLDIAAKREDLSAELIDLRDWPLPFFNEARPPASGQYAAEAEGWAAKIAEADGYVFLTPEYNHGYPAVLKNALDHIYTEWNNKPAAFVGYGGPAGGSRAVQQLRQVVVELQMVPLRHDIVMPLARRLFDADDTILDEAYNSRAAGLLDQLSWWSTLLRSARTETLSSSLS